MKNKNILGILFILTIVTVIAGCSKFLDRKPLSATLTDYGSGATDGLVFGAYNIFNTYAGFTTLPWLDFNSIRDDDAQKGSSATDGAEINSEFETFKYTKDDWATDTYWDDHYTLIQQANLILYTADSLKATDQSTLRNKGEAYFLRAYSYFELVKAYGEVPLALIYYKNAQDRFILPKSTVTQIYAQIDIDLDSASKLLPATWLNTTTNQNPFQGRLTSGAANTLWAQTYLFRSNWAKVIEKCNLVIASGQYSLDQSFTHVFKEGLNGDGKNGTESILEMQAYIGAGGSPDYGSAWGTTQNVRQGGASNTWNLGWGWNTPTQNLVSAWDSTDPRRNMTILFSGRYDGGTAAGGFGATLPAYNPGTSLDQPYWNKKVYSDPAVRANTGHTTDGNAGWINHRILRYADVLLMKAEAANESGDGATAAAMLELVRNRASGNLGTGRTIVPKIAFVNQAQMRTAIKNERRWEFAMEGYRFYDLVRWTPATDGIDALNVLGGLGYTPRCQYYPIPQPAIDRSNGHLIQNPNW